MKLWVEIVSPKHSAGAKFSQRLMKTHKIKNPTRLITSGCSTAVESLSKFVEKELYKMARNLPSRIKDRNELLNIKDNLSNKCIPESFFLN